MKEEFRKRRKNNTRTKNYQSFSKTFLLFSSRALAHGPFSSSFVLLFGQCLCALSLLFYLYLLPLSV